MLYRVNLIKLGVPVQCFFFVLFCFFFISSAVQMQYLACWYKQHFTQCAGPENIHTPPSEGTRISWGVGGCVRPGKFKEMYEALLEFPGGLREGGGGALRKNPFSG